MACVVRWDAEDVATWISQCLRMPYADAFREAGVDGEKLVEMDEADLRELGVNTGPHLTRLRSHVAIFRSQLGRSVDAEKADNGTGADGRMSAVDVWEAVARKDVGSVKELVPARSGDGAAELQVSSGKDERPTSARRGAARPASATRMSPNLSSRGRQEADVSAAAPPSQRSSSASLLARSPGGGGRAGLDRSAGRPSTAQLLPADSEWGSGRGAVFSRSAPRRQAPVPISPGPSVYNAQVPVLNKQPSAVFVRAERRTLEGMHTHGRSSPGVGKYNPPPRTAVRGGSFGSATRFKHVGVEKRKPRDSSPGPTAYNPRHHYLSGFK